MAKNILDEQSPPQMAVLQDGTEVRLVPLRRTGGKPLYVTRDGRGFSHLTKRLKEIKVHKVFDKKGRTSLKFRNHNNIRVHHAVLEAWGYPRPPGMECDHINGDPQDNRLENLEWVTPQENVRRRWINKAKKGLGYNGIPLNKTGKDSLRMHLKYAEKHGILIQLEINFNEKQNENENN